MKRVNLLPPVVASSRSGRERRQRVAIGLVVGSLCSVAWFAGAAIQIRSLHEQIQAAELVLDEALAHEMELKNQLADCEKLEVTARSLEMVQDAVPPAAVLALIADLAPREVELDELEIQAPVVDNAALTAAPVRQGLPRHVEIKVHAKSKDDTAVIAFIRRLNDSPFLAGIRLEQGTQDDTQARGPNFGFSIFMRMEAPGAVSKGAAS